MAGPLLSLQGVGKSYWRGARRLSVLSGVTVDVHAGELVAVWGRRGAGKTTLLRIAAGLELPERGRVFFDGRDLRGLSEAQRTALRHVDIGWVRRKGPREELTNIEYVALPLMAQSSRQEALRTAHEALLRVGVPECGSHHWECISDGERALVGIAHGIARSPKLLVVDDPTGYLGMREREAVTELLRSLAVERCMGVLIGAPDMPTMMSSHQIRTLSGGRLLAPPHTTRSSASDSLASRRSA